MFKFLGFGRSKRGAATHHPTAHDSGAATRQHSDNRRELVRMALKETLIAHGIPNSWLTSDVTVLAGRASGEGMMVRLIVLKWHEPLLKFLPVLQQQLIQRLDQFEPSVDHSKYVVSWQFAASCGCPYRQMPDASTWGLENVSVAAPSIVDWEHDGKAAAVAQTAPAKPKFDLPDAGPGREPAAFAATEPSPLQPVQPAQQPKFDLPPSPMDALPSTIAPTEPSALR